MDEAFLLGVRLDGTCAEPPHEDGPSGYRDLQPVAGAAEALWRLSDAGVWIRLITDRLTVNWGHQSAVLDTVAWLDQVGIPYRDLCFIGARPEVEADLYVEDGVEHVRRLRRRGNDVIVLSRPGNEDLGEPRGDGWPEVEDLVMDRLTEHSGVHGVQGQLPGVDGTFGRRIGDE